MFTHDSKDKTVKIPVGEYSVVIKPVDGKRFAALILDHDDSTLVVGCVPDTKKERKAIQDSIDVVYKRTDITWEQQDSMIMHLQFPDIGIVSIADIEKIIVSGMDYEPLKKPWKIAEWSSVTYVLSFPIVIALIPTIPTFVAIEALGVLLTIYALIVDNKVLKMCDWTLMSP